MRTSIESIVGRRIAEARRSARWTRALLAERAGLSVQSIGRLERGEQMPNLHRLEQIADLLGTNLAEVVKRSDVPSRQEKLIASTVAKLRRVDVREAERVAAIVDLVLRF